MIPADRPVQRPTDARLLLIDAGGRITQTPRSRFVHCLRPGDLVVANDAATLPASLQGRHVPTGAAIEARLAGRSSLSREDIRFCAVVFGPGDYRTRTEDREPPPALSRGDSLQFGPLTAILEALLGHPRFVTLRFVGAPHDVWAGIARHGRPIQYAHIPMPLALWDVWTPIATAPVAFEPPSASFVLDWKSLGTMRHRGVAFATLTLAAGLSSTGDRALDTRLPLDEPYRIPAATASAVRRAKATGRRIVAIGTTVVRALEHAGGRDGIVHAGVGVADQRIGAATELHIVDAILSGTHESHTSHYQVLRAFAEDAALDRASAALEAHGYRSHEFGDSILVEKRAAVGRRFAA